MKNSILIFLFFGLIACTSNTIFNKPDDLIPKDKMVELLTDLYLTSSSKPYKNELNERNIDYTFLVYEKHGIDSARFRRSNFYYTTKIDEYEKIYFEVEKNINALNTEFKGIKKEKDAIRRDSIEKVRFTKDSILKSAILKDSIFLDIINKQLKDSTQRYNLKRVKRLRRTLNMDSLRKAYPIENSDTTNIKVDSLKNKIIKDTLKTN
jgi:hypothetical protein